MINNYGNENNHVVLDRDRFRPNWRRGRVVTQKCSSTYKPIYDKGFILQIFPPILQFMLRID